MNKTETALLYFPDSTPKVAVRHLMRWIARCAPLLHAPEATGYHPCQKSFTCRQLQLVYLHRENRDSPPGSATDCPRTLPLSLSVDYAERIKREA
ncbi:DUF4248 domain-containing protein [Phocaeicola vulgatus]|nr:DUF4248 domain-containing protein [Phocaeicola vulgatus]